MFEFFFSSSFHIINLILDLLELLGHGVLKRIIQSKHLREEWGLDVWVKSGGQ